MQIKDLGQENGFWFQVNLETSPPILVVSDPKTQKQEFVFGKLGKNQKFCFDLKKFVKGTIVEISVGKTVFWYQNGLLHQEGLHREGLHREDGPAKIWADGSEFWYKNGKIHRENGPARIFANGHKEWCKNGLVHRVNGPAIVYPDGTKEWYINSTRHREDGPAWVRTDGKKQWWLLGKRYSEQEWKNLVKAKQNEY